MRHAPADSEVVVAVQADGRVCVADQGPGISPEDRERVFDRFWRGRSDRAAGPGAGLGLAIVAEVAKAHGGAVTAASANGGGALFCLSLPLLPPADADMQSGDADPPHADPRSAQHRRDHAEQQAG